MSSLTLYQYDACPFCRKVRAVLAYKKIDCAIVEVNPMSKSEIAWSSYKKVPILKHGDTQVNDSDAIIAYLDAKFPEPPLFPPTADRARVETWWKWVETLIFALPPNIYDTWGEALEAFAYISKQGKWSAYDKVKIRYGGALAMMAITKLILKKKRGITNPREHLHGLLEDWKRGLGGRAFIGGDEVSVADLTCYGALSSVRGLKVWRELISKDEAMMQWFSRVEATLA